MRPVRPIALIRLLVPTTGRVQKVRARLVPMIWRLRPRRMRSISILRACHPAPAPAPAPANVSISFNLVWPAWSPAAIAPAALVERVVHRIFRAGQDGSRVETNRLLRLVEEVWRNGSAAGQAPPPRTPEPRRSIATPLDHEAALSRSIRRRRAFADEISQWPETRPIRAMVFSGPARRRAESMIAVRRALPRRRPAAVELDRASPSARASRIGNPLLSRAAPATAAGEWAASPMKPEPRPIGMIWRRKGRGGAPAALSPHAPVAAGAAIPPGWKPRTALVWRNPPSEDEASAPAGQIDRLTAASSRDPAFAVSPSSFAPPAAGAAPAPAAAPDMGKLVEEVVRRLERIGRDERLRRGR